MHVANPSSTNGKTRNAESPATLASRVYQQLRRDLITGQHIPGRKLRIQTLCTQFGVGLSPVREALTRLSREGLVRHEDQRGFSVARIDEQHLEELTKTRCWFNEIGLRESILHGDEQWEEGVLLAFHRMSKLPRDVPDGAGGTVFNPAWEDAHRAFHTSLIAACGSRWLIDYCEQLFDAADFYRHIARLTVVSRKPRDNEHQRIVKAALARDAATAVPLLVEHFTNTTNLVGGRLAETKT
jgi:GntR family carbon starvation induced transcriptional regulator